MSNNYMLQPDSAIETRNLGFDSKAPALYASRPSTVNRKRRAKTNLRGANDPSSGRAPPPRGLNVTTRQNAVGSALQDALLNNNPSSTRADATSCLINSGSHADKPKKAVAMATYKRQK